MAAQRVVHIDVSDHLKFQLRSLIALWADVGSVWLNKLTLGL